MKKVSTYIIIGLELIGIWLLTQHRYMGFRTDIFVIMCILAVTYFIIETAHNIWYMNCITDITCNDLNDFDFTDDDLNDITEIKTEIEKRMKKDNE